MITTLTAAAREPGLLDQFLGVCSGQGVVVKNQMGQVHDGYGYSFYLH